MKINLEEARIYVRPGATDLRKGVSGLCSIIGNEMNLDALCGSAFLFCNKTHKLLKVIFWDRTGFWLAQKRLEKTTWPWPMTEDAAREIKSEQLDMLLSGIDFLPASRFFLMRKSSTFRFQIRVLLQVMKKSHSQKIQKKIRLKPNRRNQKDEKAFRQ